jgi:hypothetical protein
MAAGDVQFEIVNELGAWVGRKNATEPEETPLLSKDRGRASLFESRFYAVVGIDNRERSLVGSSKGGRAPAAEVVGFSANNRVIPLAKDCKGDPAWLPGRGSGDAGGGGDEADMPEVFFEDVRDGVTNP